MSEFVDLFFTFSRIGALTFGGGAGMVMKADVVVPALESCKDAEKRRRNADVKD